MKKILQLLCLIQVLTSQNIHAQESTEHILFETNSHVLTKQATIELDGWIAKHSDAQEQLFRVQGFADSRNSDEYNTNLAGKRAHAVADYLRSKGFASIFEQSYGEGQPVCEEATPACLALNRRVEIWTDGQTDGLTLADYFGRKKPQVFYINPKNDNELFGEEGTGLIIPAFAFQNNGRSIQDTIRIELTEFYHKGEMILNGLSTTTNEGIIESGGSILLEAFLDQNELTLQGGKVIAIAFNNRAPGDGMVTFYGNTSKLNSSSCSTNNGPLAIVNTKNLPGNNQAGTSPNTGNNPGNNQAGTSWNPANKKYNYLVRDQALYNNDALRDSARLAARYCIDHNPNYVEWFPSLDIRLNSTAGFVESRFNVQKQDYALLYDQVNCYYRSGKKPSSTANGKTTAPLSTSNKPDVTDDILLMTAKLGWINCDRWLSSNVPLVTARIDGTGEDCFYYLVFEEIQSIMPGYTDCKSNSIMFPNIPKGQKAQLITIKIQNGIYSMGMKSIVCEDELFSIEMKETSKDEIIKMLGGEEWDLEARN